MPEIVEKALWFFLQVVLYASSWFIAWLSFMGVVAVWRKLQKVMDKEKREYEMIIVKRAEQKDKVDKEILEKEAYLENLQKQIEELEQANAAASADQDDPEEAEESTVPIIVPKEKEDTPKKKTKSTSKKASSK